MKSINDIIEDVLEAEGGFVDNKLDKGGPTNFGITMAVARQNGFTGNIKDLPISTARAIYYQQYIVDPSFDKVLLVSPQVAAELVDTGVNMGPATAAKFLQTSLNAFNTGLFPDLVVDGAIGTGTINALTAYMKARKDKAVDNLLKALNCLQGACYIELATKDPSQKAFTFGWLDNRVKL